MDELPTDFDRDLWFDPLTFQGLIGAAIAHNCYADLFRADGFAKSITELRADPKVAPILPSTAADAS